MNPLVLYFLEKKAEGSESEKEDPKMKKIIKEIVKSVSEEGRQEKDRFKHIKLENKRTKSTRGFTDGDRPTSGVEKKTRNLPEARKKLLKI